MLIISVARMYMYINDIMALNINMAKMASSAAAKMAHGAAAWRESEKKAASQKRQHRSPRLSVTRSAGAIALLWRRSAINRNNNVVAANKRAVINSNGMSIFCRNVTIAPLLNDVLISRILHSFCSCRLNDHPVAAAAAWRLFS